MECRKCKHSRRIPGDAHLKCEHPFIDEDGGSLFSVISSLMGKNSNAMDKLNISLNSTGVDNGWAHWPVNFDPIWIDNCDGFEEI